MNNSSLSAQAVRAAALLRVQHQIGPAVGLCPYDLAMDLRIKVSFISAPSLEGMYSPEPRPAIILNCERPAGRRRFTCGHEIGHHVFGHGYQIDELSDENSSTTSPEEYLAQRFSSALLMPKIAVDAAFSRRGWSPVDGEANQFFVVAQELGVGFTTLVTNAEINMKTISNAKADALRRISLARIRELIAGAAVESDVFKVDEHWSRPTIDVEVKDLIIVPDGAEIEGTCAAPSSAYGGSLIATAAGTAAVKLVPGGKPLTLRISEERFAGLARYRHLEDADDEF